MKKKILKQDYNIILTDFHVFIGIPSNSLQNK